MMKRKFQGDIYDVIFLCCVVVAAILGIAEYGFWTAVMYGAIFGVELGILIHLSRFFPRDYPWWWD